MIIKPTKIDLCHMLSANSSGKDHVDYFKGFVDDKKREERLNKQLCVVCFYGNQIGGAVITETECGICGKKIHSGSSHIDILCVGCASKNGLCKHCGADVNYKNRRNLEIKLDGDEHKKLGG